MSRRRALMAGLTAVLLPGCRASTDVPARYVGAGACMPCHDQEAGAWRGSHHDLAMQPADDATVLGDFSGVTYTYYGRTSTFFREGTRFLVRTEGPAGSDEEYAVRYTFGVAPLQQYLVAFPGGRLQALSIAWDTRPRDAGGQRWFHLYPDDDVLPGDPLHWTGAVQTWNFQCASCHSTDLRKGYDPASDTYRTTWSDIDVGCEACHGPGSRHVAWAEQEGGDSVRARGLTVDLRRRGTWRFAEGATIAHLDPLPAGDVELTTCAPCHSRRQLIDTVVGTRGELLDVLRPALLDEPLYHADGQIRDEVYVYGSFVQSRMYARGVTCSDCHDPHRLRVRREGNALCTACHLAAAYDSPEHHFHEVGSAGAACVECHMPATTYMVVDARRDHSLRVPRPDLSVRFGSPNACTRCHDDRSDAWATAAVRRWYGPSFPSTAGHAERLAMGRRGDAAGAAALDRLASDSTAPGIVRATAIGLLGRHGAPSTADAVARGVRDRDPLVRFGSARAGEALPVAERHRVLAPALYDPVRAVRNEAARVLASVPPGQLAPDEAAALDAALDGYRASAMVNADRPEAHLNVAVTYLERGDPERADVALRTALRLDSTFTPAWVNLAELRRMQGRDAEGEGLLRTAVRLAPRDAAVRHALGLLLVRRQRYDEAVDELRRASEWDPGNARFGYVYAVALHSTGASERAIAVLSGALNRHPDDLDLLQALATISRDRGDVPTALRAARRLVELRPDDPAFQQLLRALRTAGGNENRR